MTGQNLIQPRSKIKIKIGDKFGRLEVIENLGAIKGVIRFCCKCKCGNTKTVIGYDLYHGKTKSCGCLHREQLMIRNTVHGMAKIPEYRLWCHMTQRCVNPKDASYKNYGGRGIKVCKEWLDSFEAFFKDMGERPEGLTIERKNNELGYFPGNCKWATHSEQNRNQRVRQNNKIGIRGISWYKPSQKYHVQIGANYKNYHIGFFKDLEQAKAARVAAERKYW